MASWEHKVCTYAGTYHTAFLAFLPSSFHPGLRNSPEKSDLLMVSNVFSIFRPNKDKQWMTVRRKAASILFLFIISVITNSKEQLDKTHAITDSVAVDKISSFTTQI